LKRLLVVVLPLLAACGVGGVQKNSGLEALLQVQRGQYFEGAFPSDRGGPQVLGYTTTTTRLRVGQTNRSLSGSVGGTSATVALGLSLRSADGTVQDDVGYWLVPAGAADPFVPGALAFEASLGFSGLIPAGTHLLKLAASDASGHFGPTFTVAFDFIDLNAPQPAALRISLSWDVDADLDLHVVQPDGTEIWSRKITSYTPPFLGTPDPVAEAAAGKLDFDSNASCLLDGRRLESVYFLQNPPPGDYIVRVDTFSLCGQAAARWRVEAVLDGGTLLSASGTALPSSTRFPHERGAGLYVGPGAPLPGGGTPPSFTVP
jgi:hypothetical protein